MVDLALTNPSNPLSTLTDARHETRNEVMNTLTKHNGIKWRMTVIVLLKKLNRLAEEIEMEAMFNGESVTLLLEGDFDEQINNQIDLI